jgi:hypothetical protein
LVTASTNLTQHGHPVVGFQKGSQRGKRVINVVGNTLKMRPAIVEIQVFVHIKDQSGLASTRISHYTQVTSTAVTVK